MNKIIVTNRELTGLIKSYGIKDCWGPLKKLVRERGLDLYSEKWNFRASFNAVGDLVHENYPARTE